MEVLHESSTLITQVLLLDQVLEFNCCFFYSRGLCVMLLWFGITCAWAGAGSDKKRMMCFESCDSRSCSRAAIVTRIKGSWSANVTRSCEEREGRDNCGSSQGKSGSRSSYLPPSRNSQGWSSCCHSTGNKISAFNSWSSLPASPCIISCSRPFLICSDIMWGHDLQSRVEQKKMKEEAKAIENRKREEAKADQVVRAAEVIQRLNKLMLQYDLNAQNLVWAFSRIVV